MAKSFDFEKMVSKPEKEQPAQKTPTPQVTPKAQPAPPTQIGTAGNYPKADRERFNTSVHPEIKKLAKIMAAKEGKGFADLLEEMILERWKGGQ